MSSAMYEILSPDEKNEWISFSYPSPATCKNPIPYSRA